MDWRDRARRRHYLLVIFLVANVHRFFTKNSSVLEEVFYLEC